MLSEWSAECAANDPGIDVPWASPDGTLHWVDLRADPNALDEITEADEYPALLASLRVLNGPRSIFFTSKCDVWSMDEEELASLRLDLFVEDDIAAAGLMSYIDVVFRERAVFASRHRAEQVLHRIDRMARELPHHLAKVECVLRHAVLDLDGVQEGYAFTVYVKACGIDEIEASERWSAALRDVATLIRSLEPTTPRART